MGDMGALATWINNWVPQFIEGSSAVAPSPVVFPGTDFSEPPYDGSADSWGATP